MSCMGFKVKVDFKTLWNFVVMIKTTIWSLSPLTANKKKYEQEMKQGRGHAKPRMTYIL